MLTLYPLLIFVGLHYFDPRALGAALLCVLLLRHRGQLKQFVFGLPGAHHLALCLPIVLGALVVATNDEKLLLLYPVAVNAAMLVLFSVSLIQPPTTIERIARLHEPDLSPAGVRYTRALTVIWCTFFVVNGAIAAYTALGASREAWALYNGLIAYLLMGALLAGERIARPWLLRTA
jgi:uncharacterized membrane protein